MARASLSAIVSVCLGVAVGGLVPAMAVLAQNAPPEAASPAAPRPDAPPGMRRAASQAILAQQIGSDGDSDAKATPAAAETRRSPVVVELFTSQGCSSCPPADALFAGYADRDDVIALALHVDYWDYLGWKDPFGKPEFTARQKAYARAAGERTVYTPQMIVEGRTALVGPRPDDLKYAIAQAKATPDPVVLSVTGANGHYEVSLSADPALAHPAVVQVVRYRPEADVEILRGENAGREVDYRNIVTRWNSVADWDGRTPTRMTLDLDGDEPAVLIVQTVRTGKGDVPLPGAILAADHLD